MMASRQCSAPIWAVRPIAGVTLEDLAEQEFTWREG
jgi:hypothetical protein